MATILGKHIPFTGERKLPGKIDQPLPSGTSRTPHFYLSPYQLSRIRIDIQGWRDSINEAESAYNPYRVKMQQMFQDTTMNEHLDACLNKRRNLTLLRKFKVCDEKGNESEDVHKLLNKSWFWRFQSFVIDAQFYGYNLISLGNVINDSLPEVSFVRRANVSPDRLVVSHFPYMISGDSWYNSTFKDWFIYVKTPTETGVSPCGYGLLYRLAKTEIYLRNNTGYNADYNEMYGQPIRKGKTPKQAEERDLFEEGLRNMGNAAYIIYDEGDDVELLEAKNSGTAYNTYDNFEQRLEKKISKEILGHADALDSVPGKLGSSQSKDNPVQQALAEIQSVDAAFVLPIINEELLPRMRNLGFNIPEGLHFEYLNDEEEEEFRKKEDESNAATADIFKTISDAGGDPDWRYFTERTGITVTKKADPIITPIDPLLSDNTDKNK